MSAPVLFVAMIVDLACSAWEWIDDRRHAIYIERRP